MKYIDITGEVVKRHVSQDPIYKKDGTGSYFQHSFIVKTRYVEKKKNGDIKKESEDYFSFNTKQSTVISAIREGFEVTVKAEVTSRPWKKEGDFFLKKDNWGRSSYQCFVELYAYAVEVIDSSNNMEEYMGTNEETEGSVDSMDNDLPI